MLVARYAMDIRLKLCICRSICAEMIPKYLKSLYIRWAARLTANVTLVIVVDLCGPSVVL